MIVMKKLIVKSDDGRKYEVNDSNRFYNHLLDYHSSNEKGDNSIHEEKGFYFTVTPVFFDLVQNWIKQNNE